MLLLLVGRIAMEMENLRLRYVLHLLDGDKAYLYAGGGIVADSEAEKEYDETWVKFRPVLRALGGKLNG